MRQEGHRRIDRRLGVTLSHAGLSTRLKSLTDPGTNLLHSRGPSAGSGVEGRWSQSKTFSRIAGN